MDFNKLSLKFFLDPKKSKDLQIQDFFAVFQVWIQQKKLLGLWIDVADYAHVPEGPGIVLVGHDANISLDQEKGRLGLLYSRKTVVEGDPQTQLGDLLRTTLEARILLEQEPSVKKHIAFIGDEMWLTFNDRLTFPNNEGTFSKVTPVVQPFFEQTFGTPCHLIRCTDPHERFQLQVKLQKNVSLDAVLQNLAPVTSTR